MSANTLGLLVVCALGGGANGANVNVPMSLEEAFSVAVTSLRWRRFDVVVEDSATLAHFGPKKAITRASKMSIQVSVRPRGQAATSSDMVIPIAYVAKSFQCQEELVSLVSLARPPDSLLVVVQSSNVSQVESCYANLTHSRSFILFEADGNTLFNVRTFKHEEVVVQNVWRIEKGGDVVDKVVDLKGAQVRMITLSWPPWLSVYDCNENKGCKTRGLLAELNDIVKEMFNFTYVVDKEPGDFWGSTPITGTYYDDNATFGGVLGAVVSQEYDIAASIWMHTRDRFYWMDTTLR